MLYTTPTAFISVKSDLAYFKEILPWNIGGMVVPNPSAQCASIGSQKSPLVYNTLKTYPS